MIRKGNTDVIDVRIGDMAVKAVYVGEGLVWSRTSGNVIVGTSDMDAGDTVIFQYCNNFDTEEINDYECVVGNGGTFVIPLEDLNIDNVLALAPADGSVLSLDFRSVDTGSLNIFMIECGNCIRQIDLRGCDWSNITGWSILLSNSYDFEDLKFEDIGCSDTLETLAFYLPRMWGEDGEWSDIGRIICENMLQYCTDRRAAGLSDVELYMDVKDLCGMDDDMLAELDQMGYVPIIYWT